MNNLPSREKQLIIGIVLIFAILLTYFFLLRPKTSKEIIKNEKKIISLKKEIEKLNKQGDENKLKATKEELSRKNEEIKALGERLLPRKELLKYLDNLTAIVKENAINLDFIQLKQLPFRREQIKLGNKNLTEAESFPVEIRLRGNNLEFSSYLWLLERLPQIIRVEKINISRTRDNLLDITVNVSIPAGLIKSEKAG